MSVPTLQFCLTLRISKLNSWKYPLFQVKVKVTQSYWTLCDPMDSIVHRIPQARILEQVVFPFSRVSSQSRDRTQVSHVAGGFFTNWTTREALLDHRPHLKQEHLGMASLKNAEPGCGFVLPIYLGAQSQESKCEEKAEWGREREKTNARMHAKLLQSCPTLCELTDCSLRGSSVHGILQARILKWGCHALHQGIFPTQGSNCIS